MVQTLLQTISKMINNWLTGKLVIEHLFVQKTVKIVMLIYSQTH